MEVKDGCVYKMRWCVGWRVHSCFHILHEVQETDSTLLAVSVGCGDIYVV